MTDSAPDVDSFIRARNNYAKRQGLAPEDFIGCRTWDDVIDKSLELHGLPPRKDPDLVLATELDARLPPPVGGQEKYYATVAQRRRRLLRPGYYWCLMTLAAVGVIGELIGWVVLGGVDVGFTIDCTILALALTLAALESGR